MSSSSAPTQRDPQREAWSPRPDQAAWLWRMPISRKLSALVLTGCLVVAVLLVVVWLSMQATDAMRAYVGGEGLWSKAQKSAVYHLTRYAYGGELSDWRAYRRELQVTLDIRAARLQMEAPDYSYPAVEKAFVRAGLARADVPNLVRGFRRFGKIRFMRQATRVWREADRQIDQLSALANELARIRAAGALTPARRDHLLQRIALINRELSQLEAEFSSTLGRGARWVSGSALWVILGSASLLLCLGLILSSRLARQIREGIDDLCKGAERVSAGDLECRLRPASGDELGALAMNFNDMVARRAAAERSLDKERQLLQTMLENLSEAVVACDADGRLSLFNRAARVLHGLAADSEVPAHWVGQHGELLEPNGHTPLVPSEDPLLCALRGQRTAGRQLVIAPFYGPPRMVLATGQQLQGPDGRCLGAVVTLHDITERVESDRILARRARELERANQELASSNRELRRLYQAEAASEAKSRFVATMSHEIRTPLHGIVGLLELFATDNLSAEQQRNLSLMRESGVVLKHLIDDVLDFAKIEAGRMELEIATVEPRGLAESVCAALSHAAAKAEVALALDCADEVPAGVQGDPGRLRQILLNLLSNAVKFTPAGGEVRLRLQRSEPTPAESRLEFSVSDTGIGMAPEALERVFESFVQAEGSTSRRYGGTGLGLAICKALVEQMGGEIGCRSRQGEGSHFWFWIPLRAAAEDCPAAPQEAPVAGQERESFPVAGPARILVAEDHPINQAVIRQQLARCHCDCLIVNDGQLALERLQQERFDLLITDIRMPRLDGYALCREWRRQEQALGRERLIIIGLSANADKEGLARCRAAGMDDALVKPLSLERLESCLRRWLAADARAA